MNGRRWRKCLDERYRGIVSASECGRKEMTFVKYLSSSITFPYLMMCEYDGYFKEIFKSGKTFSTSHTAQWLEILNMQGSCNSCRGLVHSAVSWYSGSGHDQSSSWRMCGIERPMFDPTNSPKAILYANTGRPWVGIVKSSTMNSRCRPWNLLT